MAYLGRPGATAPLTSADIPDDSITASKIASGAITAADVAADMATQTELDALAFQGEPHIIPNVLYPAVAGKLLDGSTSHSGAYGTAQSDGYSYYYTDIKGSKPIKDPRIGAHFGSQRYKTRSMQLLEQETATEGKDIFSIDGREWFRAYSTGGGWLMQNHSDGNFIQAFADCAGCYLEITGYFNDINFLVNGHNNRCDDIDISVNGTLSVDGSTTLGGDSPSSIISPLGTRFVDSSQLMHGGTTLSASLGTTPAINTVRYEAKTGSGEYIGFQGIELIAQDTTSTANKSKIQIPSQNVVSYGKKFTVSGTPHYNPFAFKTDGTTAWTSGNHNGTAWPVGTGSSANIDTATSLGLAAWVSTNYYKPYNGGRVVWWIDSSGTLKCSVNMMPPNARSIANSASLTNGTEKGDDSAGTSSAAVANNTFYPTFTDQAIDHSQAEVAKTFNYREFGNGGANAGTGGANYADASMLSGVDDGAYVMDDGLTSVAFKAGVGSSTGGFDIAADFNLAVTFIGTGLSYTQRTSATAWTIHHIAQNLPYGTHVIRWDRDASSSNMPLTLDGVTFTTGSTAYTIFHMLEQLHFYHPKKPPIPEDAVVLADYCLMADYVALTSPGATKISKGVRRCNGTRDVHYDSSSALGANVTINLTDGGEWGYFAIDSHSSAVTTCTLPYFGTTAQGNGQAQDAAGFSNMQYSVSGSAYADSSETILNNNDHTYADPVIITTAMTLGSNGIKHIMGGGGYKFVGFDVVTPIHTSSHYQTFETPYLYELVGGDRNMEQTNLVVTPDGKTWDEVTRDVSYIGINSLVTTTDTNETVGANSGKVEFDEWRGLSQGKNYANKDFAIAYDGVICLRDGWYTSHCQNIANSSYTETSSLVLLINNAYVAYAHTSDSANYVSYGHTHTFYAKRGDFLQISGIWHGTKDYGWWEINRAIKV